jgi:hypothetical protein
MSAGYVKLWASILDSSIWEQPDHVRLVWISMLAMADRHGVVNASVGGVSHAARISRPKTADALRILSEPDEDSKDQSYDGRRIESRPSGGWLILNHGKYRESPLDTPEAIANRDRQAKHRAAQAKALRHVMSRYTGDGDGDGSLNTTGGAEKPTTFQDAPPDPCRTFNDASNTPATMTPKVKKSVGHKNCC